MNATAKLLDQVDQRLDEIQLEAREIRAHSHDRIAIADVEAQLAAVRSRLEHRRAIGLVDPAVLRALEGSVARLERAVESARLAA